MSKILRIGAIGTGRVFRESHLPAYIGIDNIQLVAVYDIDREAAEKAGSEYIRLLTEDARSRGIESVGDISVKICTSAEELLDMVDIVDICTTVRWHARYAAMALEKNVHAMTEKPMARTWLEARHVADMAGKSKAFFQVNDDNIFIPRYQAIRHVIESGYIGDIQNVWIARGYYGSERNEWFWKFLENGGGGIMDYGSHAVASTWYLVGFDKVPVEVRSLGIETRQRTRIIGNRLQKIETDDDAHFKIRYQNPVNGDWINVVIEAAWTWTELGENGSDVHGYIQVDGSKGTVKGFVDEQGNDFLSVKDRFFGEKLIPVETVLSETESFRSEIRNFISSIQSGKQSMLNADFGTNVMVVLNSAQLSELRGRKSVTLEELKQFSHDAAGNAKDVWEGSDRILLALSEPYLIN